VKRAVAQVVSKNQGSFKGSFYFTPFPKIAGKYSSSCSFSRKAKRNYEEIYSYFF
jgi:hypothetical protein